MKIMTLPALLLMTVLASGCATAPGQTSAHDPWENANRKIYRFNEQLDASVLKPAATAYVKVVPEPLRKGVGNVLGNIRDVWSTANHFLQGKARHGAQMGARVLVNTTVGLAGLFDPASSMKLVRRPEDFGQTLGRWGVDPGPYLVLPLFGPSTVRDGSALAVDSLAGPSALIDSSGAAAAVSVLAIVNTRATYLDAAELLDDVALDKYMFVRDAYLARRRDAVYDGAPPVEGDDGGNAEHTPPLPRSQTTE